MAIMVMRHSIPVGKIRNVAADLNYKDDEVNKVIHQTFPHVLRTL